MMVHRKRPTKSESQHIQDIMIRNRHGQLSNVHLGLVTGFLWISPAQMLYSQAIWTNISAMDITVVALGAGVETDVSMDLQVLAGRRITQIGAWSNSSRNEATSHLRYNNSQMNVDPSGQTNILINEPFPGLAAGWRWWTEDVDIEVVSDNDLFQFLYIQAIVDGGGNATNFGVGPVRLQIE